MDTPGVIDYAGHFNPRSREGSDRFNYGAKERVVVSLVSVGL